jgi:hypothetical protein
MLILLSLNGCFSAESYLTVDQVMFRVKDGNSEHLVREIQKELDSIGFSAGTKLGAAKKNDGRKFFWYEKKRETYAAIKIDPLGCVHFDINVPIEKKDLSSAHSDFSHVMRNLKKASAWEVAEGYMC